MRCIWALQASQLIVELMQQAIHCSDLYQKQRVETQLLQGLAYITNFSGKVSMLRAEEKARCGPGNVEGMQEISDSDRQAVRKSKLACSLTGSRDW